MRRSFQVRRLAFGELLDEAFQLLRSAFARLVVFQALVYGPSLALSAYAVHRAGLWLSDLLVAQQEPDLKALLLGSVGFLSTFLVLQIVLGAITQVALAKGAADTYLGKDAWTVGALFAETRQRFVRSLGLGLFLTTLLIAVSALPLGAFAGAGVLAMNASGQNLALAVALGLVGSALGLLALAAAGFLYLRYALAGVVLAIEDTSFRDSLSRSVALMRHRYLRGLALLAILAAIGVMVGSVLSLAVPSPSFEGKDLGEIRALLPQLIRSQMLSQVVGQVAGALSGLYTSVCWTLFYFSARCEQEGFDLSHQAAQLTEQ